MDMETQAQKGGVLWGKAVTDSSAADLPKTRKIAVNDLFTIHILSYKQEVNLVDVVGQDADGNSFLATDPADFVGGGGVTHTFPVSTITWSG